MKSDCAFHRAGATLLLTVAVCTMLVLPGCVTRGSQTGASSETVVTFVQFPPQSLQTGSQVTLTVAVANDSQNMGVIWTASCSSANCGSFSPVNTVSGQGTLYTAPPTVPAGCGTSAKPVPCVNLTAQSVAFPSQTATVSVEMFTSVSISIVGVPPSPLAAGSSTQVTALVTGDPTNAGVNWQLSCSSGNCGSITSLTASDAPATYMAPSGLTASLNVTITAIAVAATSQTATTSLTVTPTATISIAFPAANSNGAPPPSLLTNATDGIIANVSNDNSNAGVDWSVSCSNGANGCGSLNSGTATPLHTSSGGVITYTPPTKVPANGVVVTVTACATATGDMTCVSTIPPAITVTAPVVSINPISGPGSVNISKTASYSATVINDNSGVDWTVTCSSTANPPDCGFFNPTTTNNGSQTTYTGPTTIPPAGTVTIQATVHDNSAVFTTLIVTINSSAAVSIAFKAGEPTSPMTTGTMQNITANVSNDPNPPAGVGLGVDWTMSCTPATGADCGYFGTPGTTTAHTANGGAVVYGAPALVPMNAVIITATATATQQGNNPGPPQVSTSAGITIVSPTVTVTITNIASNSVVAGGTDQVTAEVTNDASNEGVSWSATCTNTVVANDCGTFNPPISTSNNNQNLVTQYTAPTSVPAGDLAVTIIATSEFANAATASQPVTVTPNPDNAFLTGQYALSFSTPNGANTLGVVGSIVADGAGNITSGEEDVNSATGSCTLVQVPITGGSYAIGPDGRGTMTLTTSVTSGTFNCDGGLGNNGVQTLSFVIVSPPSGSPATSRALVVSFNSQEGSGSLDLQNTAEFTFASVAGSYAYLFSGFDTVSGGATDLGGVFTIDSDGTMSSITQDENDQGVPAVTKKDSLTASGISAPDLFGRGTVTFTDNLGNIFGYVFYVVDSGSIKFLSDSTTDMIFVLAGPAFAQGPSLSGAFVFTLAGVDTAGNILVEGGEFDATPGPPTSLGNIIVDLNNSGNALNPLLKDNTSFTGSFTATSGGRGTLTLTPPKGLGIPAPSSFAYYPTLNNGVLLLDLDGTATTTTFTSTGIALPQISPGNVMPSAFDGTYAMNFSGFIAGEEDVDGLVSADGSSVLTGTVDVDNAFVGQLPGISLAGSSFNGTSLTGRFPGSLVLNTPTPKTLSEVFYIANSNNILFIELDTLGQSSGFMQLQAALKVP